MNFVRAGILLLSVLAFAYGSTLSFTTTDGFGIILGQFNASGQGTGLTFQFDVVIPNVISTTQKSSSQVLLYLRLCPERAVLSPSIKPLTVKASDSKEKIRYYPSEYCLESRSFQDSCISFAIPDQTRAGIGYRASTSMEITLDFSTAEEHSYVFLLDACRFLYLTPPIAPMITTSFQWTLCFECFAWVEEYSATYYGIISGIWMFASMIWLYFERKHSQMTTELQQHMLSVPVSETVYMLVCILKSYNTSFGANLVVSACHAISLYTAANTVLLLSYGWHTTRMSIPIRQKMQFCILSASWALVLVSILDDHIYTMFGFIVWGVLCATLTYLVWTNTRNNIGLLLVQASVLSSLPGNVQQILYQKLQKVYILRRSLVSFFVLQFLGQFALDKWIKPLEFDVYNLWMSEGLYLLLCIVLGYTYRCQDNSDALYQGNIDLRHALVQVQPAENYRPFFIQQQQQQQQQQPQQPAQPKRNVVVIVSPNSQANIGRPN